MIILCSAASFAVPNTYDELDKHIQNELKKPILVGAAVAVVERGKVVFIKGYGNQKKGERKPVDLDTVFQLGSVSKPIAATLFAVAQKQNLISLDSPVNNAKLVSPQTQARHLLSHSSGFSRAGWNWKIEAGTPRAKLLSKFTPSAQGIPGTAYDYHNVAFSLIEDQLAHVFNMRFDAAIKKHLFFPLKMVKTTTGLEGFKHQDNRAWPHEREGARRCIPCKSYSRRYHDTVISAAGIDSSIRDMARFLQLQLGAFPHVASHSDLQQLYTPVIHTPDANRWFKTIFQRDLKSYYGYGWRMVEIGDEQIVFHGSWLKGFTNFLAFSPKRQLGIVVLTNSESRFSIETAMAFLVPAISLKR